MERLRWGTVLNQSPSVCSQRSGKTKGENNGTKTGTAENYVRPATEIFWQGTESVPGTEAAARAAADHGAGQVFHHV